MSDGSAAPSLDGAVVTLARTHDAHRASFLGRTDPAAAVLADELVLYEKKLLSISGEFAPSRSRLGVERYSARRSPRPSSSRKRLTGSKRAIGRVHAIATIVAVHPP